MPRTPPPPPPTPTSLLFSSPRVSQKDVTVEYASLLRLSSFLESVAVGEWVVRGGVEIFSSKLTGVEKQMSKSLDESFLHETKTGSAPVQPTTMDTFVICKSPPLSSPLGASPLGPLTEPSSRKTLASLILALNQIYPDYDFSLLRAQHFYKEASVAVVQEIVDERMLEVSKVWEDDDETGLSGRDEPFSRALWRAIDEAVDITECDVYSFRPGESDPFFDEGAIWSFGFFFLSRKLKKLLWLSARAVSRHTAGGRGSDSTSEFADKPYDNYDDYVVGDLD